MFGFTGTPIFEENAGKNAYGKRTTTMLFDDCLHKYMITDAIHDENVLKFSVEYISTFKKKENILDINVEAIDKEEVMNAPQRMNNVVDYIITNHGRKTHNRSLKAIFCVSSVPILIAYYTLFQQKKVAGEHNLKVAIIFSYGANVDLIDNGEEFEEDWEESEFGVAADLRREDYTKSEKKHPREYLDEFMADYNATFTTNYNTKDSKLFYQYYNDLADRVKKKQIDILLVMNIFLSLQTSTLNG